MLQIKHGGFCDLRLLAISFGQTLYLHYFLRDGDFLFMLREIDIKILRRSKYVILLIKIFRFFYIFIIMILFIFCS